MNPYYFIAPIIAICLTAGFVFTSEASIPVKGTVVGLLALSFYIQGHSLLWGVIGTTLQAILSIGLLVYFKAVR